MNSDDDKYQTQPLPPAHLNVFDDQVFDLTFFSYSFQKESAEELLQGLTPAVQEKAHSHLAQLQTWDAGKRQAQLVLAFGPQSGFSERLHALFKSVGPSLRADIFHQLPAFCQTAFTDTEKWRNNAMERQATQKSAFAERLGYEAIFRPSRPWLKTVSN